MTVLDRAPVRRAVAPLVLCVAVLVLGLTATAPASAHPFGDPQTIEVAAQDGDVRVRWRVGGTDDLTALAQHLALLPADRVLLDGAVLFEEGDADLLASSQEFEDYLLERVTVGVDGTRCPGRVLTAADLDVDGALLSFDCPGAPDDAQVEARTLTDLHPAYRTLASGPAGQRAVYDDQHPEHTWSLTDAPAGDADELGRSAAVQLGSVLALVVGVGAGAAFYVRRRGRRAGAAAS